MPQYVLEFALLDKLPAVIFSGAFSLFKIPEHQSALYLFHDKTWSADLRHILGWSREAIHSLKAANWMQNLLRTKSLKPAWLFGHGFQWMENGTYRLSGAASRYSVQGLIEEAERVASQLEVADIHIDQWGSNTLDDWTNSIKTELDTKSHPGKNSAGWYLIRDLRSGRNDLEMHTILSNYGNVHHHSMYPIAGPLNASGIGQTHCNSLLNADFENSAYTGPATIYCALFTAAPSDTGVGTETVYTNYARQAVTCSSSTFPAAAAGAISGSNANITFPTCGVTGATITDVAWMAASSGGAQPLWWGDLSASQAIASGNTPQFNVNALTMSGV